MTIDRTKLRELDKAATPGPWIVGDGGPDSNYFYDVICQEGDRERVLLQFNQNFPDKIPTDRKLIVEARNSIIPLLDALEAAEKRVADLEREVTALSEAYSELKQSKEL